MTIAGGKMEGKTIVWSCKLNSVACETTIRIGGGSSDGIESNGLP